MPFDKEAADKACRFVERLPLTDSYTGQRLKLLPFQRDFIRKLFGTLDKDGRRQYKLALLLLPRANGKSVLAASIMLYLIVTQGRDCHYCSCATDQGTAAVIYDVMAKMIRNDQWLSSIFDDPVDSKKEIRCRKTGNSFKSIPADASKRFGRRPVAALFDELHAFKNRSLWNAVTSSFGASPDRLTIVISSAGEDESTLLRELVDRGKKVISGEIKDPTFLPVIYQADAGCDIGDREQWFKAMPALGSFCELSFIQEKCDEAKLYPVHERTFRSMYLNEFIQNSEKTWITHEQWARCKKDFTPDRFHGHPVWVGCDFSVSRDWTAAAVCCPFEGRIYQWVYYWIPDNMKLRRSERDPARWRAWERQSFVKVVEGETLDHNAIVDELYETLQHYDVQSVDCDAAYVNSGMIRLRDHWGLPVRSFSNTLANICGPIVDYETAIISKTLAHNGCPVTAWMVGNARTTTPTNQGSYMLAKQRSKDKIDGVLAGLYAFTAANRAGATEPSVYESRGVIIL